MVASGSSLASEEAVAQALLASLEVDRYEAAVVSVVLEQMHRAAQAVLSDARELALHAGRDTITLADIQLADDLAAQDNYAASPLPSREAMLHLAKIVNAQPLALDTSHGIRLPPRDYQLTARNFQLVAAQPPKPAAAGSLPVRPAVSAVSLAALPDAAPAPTS